MKTRRLTLSLLLTALLTTPALAQPMSEGTPSGEIGPGVPEMWVRPGLRVTLAAKEYGESRFMEIDTTGTLYVSQPNTGALIALRDTDKDGTYETKTTVLTGYPKLHGLHFADDGHLYFATTGAVYRFKPTTGDARPEVQTVIKEGAVPAGGAHWYRSVVVKDGHLWTSIGDSGNINDEATTDRQKIWRYKIGTSGAAEDKTLWSTGVRNTEKLRFRVRPDGTLTHDLYGADHGSDLFGNRYGEPDGGRRGGPITDQFPPCEFNQYVQGFDYGHPFVTGLGLPRPEFATRPDILQRVDANTAPAWCFPGHWAPNGFTFVRTPATLGRAGDAVVALHGSWNARQRQGYRVERVMFDEVTGKPYGAQTLVNTLRRNGRDFSARPCDVIEAPDGTLLFTDSGGKIYRISRATK
jgi:glucose/arabinose dehydrogenase